jgi:branched-chain amino acid transport system ATP-binding protein
MYLLEADKINAYYGAMQIVSDLSLQVNEGEILSVVGGNGAGKTTLINAISGVLRISSGEIRFLEERIDSLPFHEVAQLGVIQIPEGRRLFPHMTVAENLDMGAYPRRAKPFRNESLRSVYDIFPVLAQRGSQLARTLSGGEQQMVAIGRGLMGKPKLLMLDEPSLGLAPILVKEIFEAIHQINKAGTTILLVEQDVHVSLTLSHRGYVLENGAIVMEGKGLDLLQDPHIKDVYLGV